METDTPKPIVCKAAVSRAAGEPLQIEEVVVDPPKAHEVRIKIICTSLCHSDITFWRMKESPAVFPRIFGHESVGLVESVGEGVDEVAVGDTVLPVFMPHCRECSDCRSSKGNFCKTLPFTLAPGMPRDRTSRFTSAATGEVLHNFVNVSGFSQYTVVDVANIVKVMPGVPPEKACLLSCGVTTGVGAAWKASNVEEGSTVAVFGLGTIGLSVVQGAKICGAKKIIGIDINPKKFEIGKKLGLTDFVNPKEIGERQLSEVIREMTVCGADYCFECIGLTSVMATAFQSSRSGGGKTIILGAEMNRSPIAIDAFEILAGKSIQGSFFGGIKPKTDIPILMKWYLNKELLLDEFITHEVALEDINKAFDLLIEGKSLRCIIWMDEVK